MLASLILLHVPVYVGGSEGGKVFSMDMSLTRRTDRQLVGTALIGGLLRVQTIIVLRMLSLVHACVAF